jgi:hypothetical protein
MTFGAWRSAARRPLSVCVEVNADFPLVERGLLVGVLVFHRIFQGDHVHERFLFVDDV